MSQQTGMAFLDLTMQYHKSLAGDPLSQAQAALEKYLSANQIFYDNWEDYQELRKL